MKEAVNVIVQKQNKILILKRSHTETHYQNLWDLPGGEIKEGEVLKDAAEREVMEESGLEVKADDNYFSIFRYDLTPAGEVFGFKAKIVKGKVSLSKEHTEFKWVSKKDFDKLEYTPSVAAFIREFFKKI